MELAAGDHLGMHPWSALTDSCKMPPRSVVADSDDELDDLVSVKSIEEAAQLERSPVKTTIEAPEIEPLTRSPSPTALHIQPPQTSSTDPSFFDRVYDEQCRAPHHDLVENIIRQSQKANGSSSDISLPAKGKGKGKAQGNVSSATDITSPLVLTKYRKSQLTQVSTATEVSTPRKSAKGEWDVPSSGDELAPSRSARSSKARNKTYGKRKGASPRVSQTGNVAPRYNQPTPAAKKRQGSPADLLDPPESPIFYVAESHLTAMQKLQYEKVQLSPKNAAGQLDPAPVTSMPLPPANHKSSGATTIAYSTPSRYASSIPKLPWQEQSTMQCENSGTIINVSLFDQPSIRWLTCLDQLISSSPDAIVSDNGRSQRKQPESSTKSPSQAKDIEHNRTAISSVKRKRTDAREDNDELGHHSSRESDEIGFPREIDKPRPSRRRSKPSILEHQNEDKDNAAVAPVGDNGVNYLGTAASDEANTSLAVPDSTKASISQTKSLSKKRGRPRKKTANDDISPESVSSEQHASIVPDSLPLPAAPPVERETKTPMGNSKRKAGRPKKQPVSKQIVRDEDGDEQPADIIIPVSTVTEEATAMAVPADGSKKKRARPKNSETTETEKPAGDAAKAIDVGNSSLTGNDPNTLDVQEDIEPEPESKNTKPAAQTAGLSEVARNSLVRSHSTISDPDKSLSALAVKPTASRAGKIHLIGPVSDVAVYDGRVPS
ncbi:uncharacterized protein BCR38DRAFT_212379 [Pseudomassariella vexata]|uniref:Uncharacterized protein n=1 Tax=Pseudomassariella vexata TaxID=1141098 RepID=A0A1Y2DZ22_9PEZI|nr:uncharacterized protein BCR38DRAFT_212379 [Pseudomassariella vexata]ORY64344.1 hypothetical protein BCR38DRAFT_212379 [Pseudomassariella vexata]